MAKLLFATLFAAAAFASPIDLEERNLICNVITDIIDIMHAQDVATPFCSSLLSIPTVTQTSTVTSTPKCQTITTSVDSTATLTTVSTSVVYGVTTVYPGVTVSTTSTCSLGATVIPTTTAAAAAADKLKRGMTSIPIGTPKCLTGYAGPSISSACSCLSISTPTKVTVSTDVLPTATITKVIASTASVTVTSVTTSTSFTSTYSGTQYFTSTYTILPSPSSTLTPGSDGEVFGVYPSLNFDGLDIQNFFCYANGPAVPAPFAPSCTSFSDCVAECAYYNDNSLGASTNTQCGAVVYNAPPDGSSGSCYLKTGQTGCGGANSNSTTGVLLPLIANDVQ